MREIRPQCVGISICIGLPLKAESVTLTGSTTPPVGSADDLRPSKLDTRLAQNVQAWASGVFAVRPVNDLPRFVRVTLSRRKNGWYSFKEYTPLRTLRYLASLSIRHLMSTVDVWNGVSLKQLCSRPTIEFVGLSKQFGVKRSLLDQQRSGPKIPKGLSAQDYPEGFFDDDASDDDQNDSDLEED